MKKNLLFLLFFLVSFSWAQAQISPGAGNILHVDKHATGTGDGSSWVNAIPELADALVWAKNNESSWASGGIDSLQIWVAGGTYKPLYSPRDGANFVDEGRDNTFLLVNNVQIYGGFAGGETDLNQRDPATNPTILSGDTGAAGDNSDNAYHVVLSSGPVGTARLGGVTVTAGNANGSAKIPVNGNDINRANGGGMVNFESSPNLTNIIINGNTTNQDAGGMFNNNASPNLINVIIAENTAARNGGGMRNYYSSPNLTNVTIIRNSASAGDALYNNSSSPVIANSILWGGIWNDSGSNYNATYSLLKGRNNTTNGNISAAGLTAADIFAGPASGDYTLKSTSPAINSGSNAAYINAGGDLTGDVTPAGQPRLIGLNIDMGAFELFMPFPDGSGRSSDPYHIATSVQLDSVRHYLNAHFIQTTDIDLDTAAYNTEAGWQPIGDNTTPFIGNYNGDGHTITGLFINRPNYNLIGLFGLIKSGASLQNVELKEVDVTGGNTTAGLVGGSENSTISQSHVSGFVYGESNTGGLVGNSFYSTVSNCYATVSVEGYYDSKGGLVGYNSSNSSITKSYATGDVSGGNYIGGLVGSSYGPVSQSYATGAVSGTSYVGGLVGNNGDIGSVTTSYATGLVSLGSGSYSGALVGYNVPGGSVTKSYWNTQTTGQNRGMSGSQGSSTGLTYEQMQQQSSFSDFNFSSVWSIDEDSSYPYLQTNEQTPHPGHNTPPTVAKPIADINAFDGGNDVFNLNAVFSDSYNDRLTYTVDSNTNSGLVSALIDNATDQLSLDYLVNGSGTAEITIRAEDIGGLSVTDTVNVTVTEIGSVIYVDSSAVAGNNNGTSWVDALTDLQDALSAAPAGKQIWVAAGTYFPTSGTDRTASFHLIDSVAVYGGFAGGETALNQRDPAANPTLLSGNIGAADKKNDNSYHVLVGSGTGATARLDGVTVTAGNANATSGSNQDGGGMYNFDGSPTLANVIFSGNNAGRRGGGMNNQGNSNPMLTNVAFNNNNSAVNGGGMFNVNSSPTLINVIFSGNNADERGGGMWNHLGSSPVLTNVTFSGNSATNRAGGMINNNNSNPVLTNVIIWGNSAPSDPGVLNLNEAVPTYSYSLIQDLNPGGTSLDGTNPANDPLFVNASDPAGPDNIFGTADDGLALQAESPAIDAGKVDTTGLNLTYVGLGGRERLNGTAVDMGAYEAPLRLQITGSEGWRMMSSPFENLSYGEMLDTLWTQGFSGSDSPDHGSSNVYYYDEATRQFTSLSEADDIPESGTGYITYVYDDDDFDEVADGFPKIIQVDSTQNSGSISPTLSFTDTDDLTNNGWNLVGNPYGATIDWDASGWTTSNLDASFYIWNADAGEYQSWNGVTGTLASEGLIVPWQGFWVKADSADPELTFTDEIRSAGGIFRKEKSIPQIKFELAGAERSTSTILMLEKSASLVKDRLDAYKLASLSGDYLSLFTLLNDGSALNINALPAELEEVVSVDLEVDVSDLKGAFELTWDLQALPEDWQFVLIDNITGEEVDLWESSAVSFQLSANKLAAKTREKNALQNPIHRVMSPKVMKVKSTSSSRFTLIVSSAQAVANEKMADIPSQVELQQNYPNPFNPITTIAYGVPEAGEVSLEVFDLLGRKVATLINQESIKAGRHNVQFDARSLASGLYFYRLNVGKTVITKKLTLIK